MKLSEKRRIADRFFAGESVGSIALDVRYLHGDHDSVSTVEGVIRWSLKAKAEQKRRGRKILRKGGGK